MCVRCMYDLALPSSDLCEHCKKVSEMDTRRTHELAALLTAEHERHVLETEEAA